MTRQKRNLIIIIAAAVLAVAAIVIALIALEGGSSGSNASGKEEKLTYKEFIALSLDEQAAFKNSFSDTNEYLEWYWDAYDTWKAEQQPENDDDDDKIIVDDKDTVIDAEDLLGSDD